MRIKMLCSMAGADFALSPGDETERFSDAECVRFVEAGIAVPAQPKVERAVVAPTETRVKGKRK